MTAKPKLTTYCVRGTATTSAEQVAFECEGFAMAHAKAAALRMAGYRDVVTSLREGRCKLGCQTRSAGTPGRIPTKICEAPTATVGAAVSPRTPTCRPREPLAGGRCP